MFEQKTRVLLILPQVVVDQARGLAGQATTRLRVPVSLQIVLRALLAEGLKRGATRALLAHMEGQAKAVRHSRSVARRRRGRRGVVSRRSRGKTRGAP
jgi:hypothetical protein